MLGKISAVLSALKGGVELYQDIGGEQIDIRFSVRDVLMSGDSEYGRSSSNGEFALAFVVITNASSSPQSITDITINLGEADAGRIPITDIDYTDTSNTMLTVSSFSYVARFRREDDELHDLRVLSDDVYLRENESESGVVLFTLPEIEEVSDPVLELTVGADKILTHELES